MKRAITRIRTSVVHNLLRLPADVEIAGFHVEPERNGITLRLTGAGLPGNCEDLDPGSMCREVTCRHELRTPIVVEFKGFA